MANNPGGRGPRGTRRPTAAQAAAAGLSPRSTRQWAPGELDARGAAPRARSRGARAGQIRQTRNASRRAAGFERARGFASRSAATPGAEGAGYGATAAFFRNIYRTAGGGAGTRIRTPNLGRTQAGLAAMNARVNQLSRAREQVASMYQRMQANPAGYSNAARNRMQRMASQLTRAIGALRSYMGAA